MPKRPEPGTARYQGRPEVWTQEVRALFAAEEGQDSVIARVLTKVRRCCVAEAYALGQNFMRPATRPHRGKWREVEQHAIAAMLYHSDSTSDCKRFLDVPEEVCEAVRGGGGCEPTAEQRQLVEEFTLLGRQVNLLLAWMLSRLDGQKAFNLAIEDTVATAQRLIDAKVAEKEVERKEAEERAQMAAEEAAARAIVAQQKELARIEEEKAKEAAAALEAAKVLKPPAKAAPKVVTSKSVGRVKRATVHRLAPVKPLPKGQPKKTGNVRRITGQQDDSVGQGVNFSSLKPKLQDSQTAPVPARQGDDVVQAPEDKKEDEEEKEKEKEVVLADLTEKELKELKGKIQSEAYRQFLEDSSRGLPNLCILFDLEPSRDDTSETVKAIFRRVKARLVKLINLEDELEPVAEKLVLSEIDLGSPAEEVARDVLNRLVFLFEINTSITYQSEVTKISDAATKASLFKHKRMVTIMERQEEEEDAASQQQQRIQTETSRHGDDDDEEALGSGSESEELTPVPIARSASVPAQASTSIQKLGAGPAASGGAAVARKQSSEYSDWIEGYRKWRVWNRKGREEQSDLFSADGSPLHAVVAFARCSQVFSQVKLRSVMLDHQYVAQFRLFGLQQQEKLFTLCAKTILGRFVWGGQSSMLRDSVLNQIETCGVSMTQKLNAVSRSLAQQLMNTVVAQIEALPATLSSAQAAGSQGRSRQDGAERKRSDSRSRERSSSRQAAGPGSASAASKTALAEQQKALKRQQEKLASSHEAHLIEELRKLVHTMNDIRVLLSSVYTREYVLESLRQD